MSKILSLPQEFKDKWNELASDMVVDQVEVGELRKVASKTPSTEDDEFLRDLKKFTTVVPHSFSEQSDDIRKLCEVQNAAHASGLNVSGVKVQFMSVNGYPRELTFGRKTSVNYCGGKIRSAEGGDDEEGGPKLHLRAGYHYSGLMQGNDEVGEAHGINLALMFAPWSSPYFYPSIEAEVNGTFSAGGVSGGGGVGLNAGYGEMIGGTLKMMARGYGASIKDKWESGWSLDLVAGLRTFIFYLDASFPVTGDDLRPYFSVDIGVRFNLL